jgi:microcystin-dependent protein
LSNGAVARHRLKESSIMGTPFLGELKIISWNYPPKGWAFANGALLPINQNQALFSLFGTTYGGDGRVNFGLPNLQGRVPVHMGNSFTLGQLGGEQAHTLSISELPAHNHTMSAKAASQIIVGAAFPGPTKAIAEAISTATNHPLVQNFGTTSQVAMNPASVGPIGGSQAHNNLQPCLCLNIIVALQGIFPSQT